MGKFSPTLFQKLENSALILGENALIVVICGLNFSFNMQSLRVSWRKSRRFFPAGPFFLMLYMIVYESVLIARKLPCPKKILVMRLSRVVLIPQMNHLFMKCPHPLMKYPQLLMPGILFIVNCQECFIINKNKTRTFWNLGKIITLSLIKFRWFFWKSIILSTSTSLGSNVVKKLFHFNVESNKWYLKGTLSSFLITHWAQDVNWTHRRSSEDIL